MICTHSPQPLRLVYLRNGQRHEFIGCASCAEEFRSENRVIETQFQNDYVSWVVAEAEVKRLLETKGSIG